MKFTTYPFDRLIQDVKDETGIENIRNRIDEIKRLVRRAEYEINPYSGFLVKKRMILFKGNGNFDGQKIKLPKDYVELDKIEQCCNDCKSYTTNSHIILCGDPKDKVEYIYWGIQFTPEGNPVIPYNHGEAVIAYIIWKMFSKKVFMGEGSANVKIDYRRFFNDRAHEARGEDMFPDEQSLMAMYQTNRMSSLELLRKTMIDACQDCCLETMSCMITITGDVEEEIPELDLTDVYIGQYGDILSTISDVESIDSSIITNYYHKSFIYQLEDKTEFEFVSVGRIVIAIESNETDLYRIFDTFDNDITDTVFDTVYSLSKSMRFYVSKNYYTPGDYKFKILKQ